MVARIDDEPIPIEPLELRIAYKLSLGVQKDIGEAVHLFRLLKQNRSEPQLEVWVTRLNVDTEYERLKCA